MSITRLKPINQEHVSEVSISVFQEIINKYHHLDIQKQSYVACSLQDSYTLNLKDFSTKSRLMASLFILIRGPDCQACLEFLLLKSSDLHAWIVE